MLQKNYIQKQMRTKYKYQKKDIYIYMSSEKWQQIIDKLRLVSYKNRISNNNKFLRQCTKSVI